MHDASLTPIGKVIINNLRSELKFNFSPQISPEEALDELSNATKEFLSLFKK